MNNNAATDKPHRGSVINLSLGGKCTGYGCSDDPLSALIESMIEDGIAFAVSAGNDGTNANWYTPASIENVITVGASSDHDVFASFSNYGSALSVIAPGVKIWSACYSCPQGATCQEADADMHDSDSDNSANSVLPLCTDDESYSALSGTSMAAPHGAGMLAQELEKLAVTTSIPAGTEAAVLWANHNLLSNAVSDVVELEPLAIKANSDEDAFKTTRSLLQITSGLVKDNLFFPMTDMVSSYVTERGQEIEAIQETVVDANRVLYSV